MTVYSIDTTAKGYCYAEIYGGDQETIMVPREREKGCQQELLYKYIYSKSNQNG